MKPSKNHSNRQWHNWVLYDIGDKFRKKYSIYYKGTLVDLGCGEAPYKDFFLKYVDTYIGVDWTKTLHNSKADIVSDLNIKINLDNETADTIVSLSVMEHLYEPQTFLNEAYRILKKDSYIILGVPWMWGIHEAPHDYFRYTSFGLEYMFQKAGFKEIKIEPTTGFFTTWIIKMNYFMMKFVRGPKLIKYTIKLLLLPFWYISQKIAPILDKLDRNWKAETQAYYVVAKK